MLGRLEEGCSEGQRLVRKRVLCKEIKEAGRLPRGKGLRLLEAGAAEGHGLGDGVQAPVPTAPTGSASPEDGGGASEPSPRTAAVSPQVGHVSCS